METPEDQIESSSCTIICNGCHKWMDEEIRWKCVNCLSYDLCDKCEQENPDKNHPSTHLFIKITKPLPQYGLHRPLPNFYEKIEPNPDEWAKKMTPLICPGCIGGMKGGPDACGRCARCGAGLGSCAYSFCPECSWILELCYVCENPIYDGDHYVKKIDEKIAYFDKEIESEYGKEYNQRQKENLEALKKEIAGKKKWELMAIKTEIARVF